MQPAKHSNTSAAQPQARRSENLQIKVHFNIMVSIDVKLALSFRETKLIRLRQEEWHEYSNFNLIYPSFGPQSMRKRVNFVSLSIAVDSVYYPRLFCFDIQ